MMIRLTLFAALGCLLLTGCGGGEPDAADIVAQSNDSNIKRMANLYNLVQMKPGRKYAGPKDEAEFKKILGDTAPLILERMGVSPGAIDEIFVSERDGEPFEIRYGVTGSPYGCQEPVIFEKTGVDGKRLVGFLNQTQKEVDGSEYDQLFSGQAASTNGRDNASGS